MPRSLGRTSGGIRRAAVIIAAACAFAIASPTTGPAQACAFHYYAPERTAIDWLIESDHLVLARNHPDNEFAFQVVGTLRDGGWPVRIAEIVDSGTRLRLNANPDDAVLFAFDGPEGAWRRVAYLDADYRELVDTVLSGMGSWGPGYDPARFAIFEALQDHPNPALRRLALQEIDQAPYDLLRAIDLRIPVEELLAELWTPQGYAYQSIRVLLLGLSGSDDARAEIRAHVNRLADQSWGNGFGAFATALIELDGVDGVARLEEKFLTDPGQPLDKLEMAVEALAIQNGVALPELGDRISAALGRFVDARPEGAALVARQFSSRNDWSQAGHLATLMQDQRLTSAADLMSVAVYVAQAKEASTGAPTGNASRG